ncbi:MAG: septal ring lytic transglycosylase RlpA family protein, partial [Pseudolabrys sp.]
MSALSIAKAQSGIASIYSGGRTANGEKAAASGMTAAHKTLPFGTLVRVTHQRSGRSVVV